MRLKLIGAQSRSIPPASFLCSGPSADFVLDLFRGTSLIQAILERMAKRMERELALTVRRQAYLSEKRREALGKSIAPVSEFAGGNVIE